MHISWLHRLLVAFVAAIGMAGAAQAKDLLVLADDIPAGLDYDGPTASLIPTYGGIANLLEPLVYYADGEVNEEGVQLLDFDKFEGRLAESWTYDPETFTWTFTLRQGVKGCNGAHLLTAWHLARESLLYRPWFVPTAATRMPVEIGLDVELLHQRFVDTVIAGAAFPEAMRTVTDAQRAQFADRPANEGARKQVHALRAALVAALAAHGATHYQIGTYYPYLDRIDPGQRNLIESVKRALDPKNLMSPGALGL